MIKQVQYHGNGELRLILRNLPVGDSIIIPFKARIQEIIGHFNCPDGSTFSTRKDKKTSTVTITKFPPMEEAFGKHFVYFSKKLREFPPRAVLVLGKTQLDSLVDGNKLLKSFDHPFIKSGFYHDKLFNLDGTFNEPEFKRLQDLFITLTGKELY